MRLNTKSVRFQTSAGAALALAALLAIAGISINWFVGRQVDASFDATLVEQATDRALLLNEGAPVESVLTPVGREEVVAVFGPDGQILGQSADAIVPGGVANLPLGASDFAVVLLEPGEGREEEMLRGAIAETADGQRVLVANELEAAQSTRQAVRTILLTVLPLTALAGAAISWLVTGRALQPVQSMQNDLDEVVRAGDGRRVRTPGTGDEIDELGSTINQVLDRLDAQTVAQRQFVADASHELKSPLANARAIIETAAAVPDAGEYQRVTSAVAVELERLRALVDDLLYLAAADEGAPSSPATIDLADIIFDESERIAAVSTTRIVASEVAPVAVFADPAQVARAIRNLLENANRFATSQVDVSIEIDGAVATVVVADDGPGIAEVDRAAIFERFKRVDTDRARSAGGTGLGLSIVASIAQRNGGAVALAESTNHGARFELSFPVAGD